MDVAKLLANKIYPCPKNISFRNRSWTMANDSLSVKKNDSAGETTTLLPHIPNHPGSSSSSSSGHLSRKSPNVLVIFASLVTASVVLSVARYISGGSHLLSSSFSRGSVARPLKKLHKPVVLLISSDGFRFGYQFKTETPNIKFLISGGTEAELGLIPVFPTVTFPNHYSIATGLYPAYHGIIMNRFTDPVTGNYFSPGNIEPEWWFGEPIWVTAVKQGLKAATYFWAGSEVHKGPWDCPEKFCFHYNKSVPFEERVDAVLSYFDLPTSEIPDFISLYLEEPDSQGHDFGPDDPRVTEAIARVDDMIGRLIRGLRKRHIFDDVHIILVGDHGMVTNCDKKVIHLDDLADWVKIPADWVLSYSPVLAISPRWGKRVSPEYTAKKNAEVVAKMNSGLSSGNIKNGEYLNIYLKEKLPERLHYSASYRIPPIIGMVGEGIYVRQSRTDQQECFGTHGYDNQFFSMRSIFIGHGPRFGRGRKVASFENVEIYNVVATILGLKPAPNNGSAFFPGTILLPEE